VIAAGSFDSSFRGELVHDGVDDEGDTASGV